MKLFMCCKTEQISFQFLPRSMFKTIKYKPIIYELKPNSQTLRTGTFPVLSLLNNKKATREIISQR
jgi:hypothetical protein